MQVVERERFGGGRGARLHGRASKQRTHVREQHAGRHGLGDELVGAELEAHDAVEILLPRGEEEDGQRGAAGPRLAADLEPVQARQHHVQEQQVRIEVAQAPQGAVASAFPVQLQPVASQVIADEPGQALVVLDEQHHLGVVGIRHVRRSSGMPRRCYRRPRDRL